jgi:predicted nucleic acid-binding protein
LDTLLIDESEGRREAIRRQLHVTETVAILEKAAQRGLTDFGAALERLEQTNVSKPHTALAALSFAG